MHTIKIGDVTITSIIERDGPWRRPEDMFPAYDPEIGKRHLAQLDPLVFDAVSVLARPAAGLWTNARGKTEVRDDHLQGNLRACHDLLLPAPKPHRGGRLVKRSCSWSRQASLGRS